MSKLTFVRFTQVKAQTPQVRITSSRVASTAISAQRRRQPERGFTISRAREYHKIDSSLSIREPAHGAPGSTTWRDSTMTNFKLLSVVAILSTAIVTPVFAQQAVQEPGNAAFYQSLGVGSHDSATASALASTRSGSYATAPVKRISAKHHANAHKM
jgi:hypothetical protein